MKAFKREFEMLAKFSNDAHPHLISLLAAYKQFKAFYLVFHWADADLLRFWKLIKPNPDFNHKTVVWVAEQCAGLASGLLKIHRYESVYEPRVVSADGTLCVPGTLTSNRLYGRHGDIKPANILWFRDPRDADDRGTLKISDFGLAEFHTIHSRSNRPKSQVATSPSYRPPEYDMKDGTISRSYDIWTIGCLYLEFIAWLLGGWDLVKSFTIMRATPGEVLSPELREYTFFELEEGGETARVKQSVTKVSLGFLHSHHSFKAYFLF
jgi:serine/threonine protein kinase